MYTLTVTRCLRKPYSAAYCYYDKEPFPSQVKALTKCDSEREKLKKCFRDSWFGWCAEEHRDFWNCFAKVRNHAYTYTGACTCVHTHTHTHTHVCTCTHTHAQHVHTITRTCAHAHTNKCVHTHACTARAHNHTHMCTRMCTIAHPCAQLHKLTDTKATLCTPTCAHPPAHV